MKLGRLALWDALREKETNRIVIGVMFGLNLVWLAFSVISFSFYGGQTWSSWWHQNWPGLLAFVIVLVLTELVSRVAKK